MKRRPFLIAAAVVAANTAAILPVVMLTRSSSAADEVAATDVVTSPTTSPTSTPATAAPTTAAATTAAPTTASAAARQRVQIESCMLVGDVGSSSVNPAGPEGAAVYGAGGVSATSAECVVTSPTAGSLALTVRYASISDVARDVFVNDIPLNPQVHFAPATDGTPWAVQTVVIPVDSGDNRVRIDLADVWFDWLEVAPSGPATSTTATTGSPTSSSAPLATAPLDTAPIDFALAPETAAAATTAAPSTAAPSTSTATPLRTTTTARAAQTNAAGTTTTAASSATSATTAKAAVATTSAARVTVLPTVAAAVTAAPVTVSVVAGTSTSPATTAATTSSAAPTTTRAATTTAAPTTFVVTSTTAAPTTAAPTTATTTPAPWTLSWSDEFNAGLGPDWTAVGTGMGTFDDTFGIECYSPSQVAVSGGALQLTAQQKAVTCNGTARSWVSGLVTTRNRFTQTYGRFEARMKLPVVKGTWPAFWLMPANPAYGQWPNSGEIDVMEYVAQPPQTVFQTVHWAEAGVHKASSAGANLSTPASDWHRYAVEWEPRALRWYVDDVLVHSYTVPNGTAPFDQPFYVILNQAVGGDWPGAPDPAAYPSTVSVDWVRVYKRG